MKLGNAVQIIINTKDIENSLQFYEKLGFTKVAENNNENNWVQITDGQILILLNQDKMHYTGLAYYSEDMAERVAVLEKEGIEFDAKINKAEKLYLVVLNEPNGVTISLMNHDSEKIFKPGGEPVSKCGKLGEISIETSDFDKSVSFWEKLGFSNVGQGKGFVRLNDGLINIGLYAPGVCKHLFKNPSITYFEPDMAARITGLKQEGINFAENIPDQDGIITDAILEAPEGTYLFLFKG